MNAPPVKPAAWDRAAPMPEDVPRKRRRYSGPELQALVFPPQRFAVPDLVPEGLTVLAGAPKLGKSWLALAMAAAVAGGERFLGAIDVEQGPALVLALEDGERRLHERMAMILGPGSTYPDELFIDFDPPPDLLGTLTEHLDAQPETRLIVVDTFTKVRPPTPAGGPSYVDDYAFAGKLQSFALNRGVALLVVHHTRKGRSDDFVEGVSGTHGITGAADSIVLLDRDRSAEGAVLHVTGRDLRDDLAWQLERVGPVWQLVDKLRAEEVEARRGLGDTSTRIVEAVAASPEPVSAAEVAQRVGIGPEVAKDYLARLARDGRLHRPARGRYSLPVSHPGGVAYVALSPLPGLGDSRDACDERDTCDVGDTLPEGGAA